MQKLVSLFLLMTLSTGACALGLGNIELNSGLNQPFDARIELLSPTSAELDSLNIRMADVEAFDRAGIEWTLLLSSLRFEIEINETGADYIRITSREAIREPYLNFLIQANWSSGRLFREYTVLLDPPLYDPNAGRISAPAAPIAESTPPATSRPTEPVVSPSTTPTPTPTPTPGISPYSGDEFGPVSSTDTLWSIASRIRPDDTVSVQQMMLALLRANPQAFIESNINGLRQGQILRIPDRDEITNTSVEAAIAEVRSQNSMWEEIRATFADSATQRAIGTSSQPSSAVSGSTAAADSELRLVSPGSQDTDSGQTAASSDSDGSDDAGLALANEQLESLSSENAELRDQLQESETIIDDLSRLVELKDDELASLQQQEVIADVAEDISEAEPEPEAQDSELIDETIVSLDLDDIAEETVVEEPVAEPVEQPAPPPIVTTQTETMGMESGLVEQIMGFVFANLMLVGGALGALILGVVGFMFVKKRQAAGLEDEDVAAITEFPDFDADSDEMDMSGTVEDLAVGDSDAEEEASEDKTAFIGEVESAELAQDVPQPAAPAEAEAEAVAEPEEDPLAEVNVFLAYEHFDQAEQFVRDAIEKDPKNLEFHNKLLEVFYSSGDKVKYEEEAKVLHDLVGGEGPHWEMAGIMWQEISPNRALFSEPVEGDDEVAGADDTKGGIVDLTADDGAADEDDGALDFDLGMGDTGDSASANEEGSDEGVLDITAGSEDVLDLTADSSHEADDDLLDVTAAVGLGGAGDEEDILDISAAPAADDDLLDVTAHTDVDAEEGEELLDVTAAIDLPGEQEISAETAEAAPAADDNSLDFDIGGLDIEDSDSESAESNETAETNEELSLDDNILEFESGSSSSDEDESDDLNISLDEDKADEGIELDMGADDNDSGLEISLDEEVDDGEIKLDFASEDEQGSADEISLDMDGEEAAVPEIEMESTLKIDMDDELQLQDEVKSDEAVPEIDMESTYKLDTPDTELESTLKLDGDAGLEFEDDDDDDDDEDHTVFVPRTADTGEQSAEDEVATKLDLAKAYVELGDKDSAKSILDEIIAEGNDAQRQQAEELKGQID